MTQLSNNELIIYSIATVTVILVTSLIIQTYFASPITETPNSHPTFYFTRNQLSEIEVQAENTIIDPALINSGKICYPEKYPMISAEDPISDYSKFDLDFLAKDFTGNLIEKMEELSINCPFENYELFGIS
uniref:hypothetical protein n=1 Tax=Russula rosea TaxID=176822 RepID=UPI0020291CEF|nr:hypothetical protein NDC34_mgp06 [Russula rosea]UHA57048.1 hypothetical protein [Russula rosea]